MDAVRRDFLTLAIIFAVGALFVWVDSTPWGRVPVGVGAIVLAVLLLVAPVVRPRAAGVPDLPLWNKIGVSIGTALFGVSRIWPKYHNLSTLAVLCMFAPQIPLIIRQFLGTDRDSVGQ